MTNDEAMDRLKNLSTASRIQPKDIVAIGWLMKQLEGWMPMDYAPKNGEYILVCNAESYVPQSVCWSTYHPNATGKACWRTSRIAGNKVSGITHWRPLPPPPQEAR